MSTPDNVKHKVKFGDTLNRIAKKHNTTVELIMKANGLADTNIKAGTELKVQNSNFSVLVDKSKKTLTLKSDDEVIKIYPIATGTNDSTPTGVFRGVNKIVNPPWYTPEGIIPPESPKNILGTRWYGLSEKGYGIHGTTEPESIGTSSTQGCVRMLNEDIEELYSILPVGTEVEIID